jgi:hypothetical protein
MLSEALTSLENVRARLRQDLLQQPEYRALLVIDQAMSELAAFLGPCESEASPGGERRAYEALASTAALLSPAPTPAPPAAAPPRAPVRFERAPEAAPTTPAIFKMAAALRELAGIGPDSLAGDYDLPPATARTDAAPHPSAVEADAATSEPAQPEEAGGEAAAVSGMAALYLSIGDAADEQTSPSGDYAGAQPPLAVPSPVSGMAATLYETAGDAPDVALGEFGDAPIEPAAAEVRARSGMEKMIARSAQTPEPSAAVSTMRSYLPYFAAQRLGQSRRL